MIMSTFDPRHPDVASRVRESFAQQVLLQTLGVHLGNIRPAEVEIKLPFREDLTQQHGPHTRRPS